jgi:TatD DNase family protein
VTRKQPIHLHCFAGDPEQVSEWLKSYPNTYFGFTGLAKTFDSVQIAALNTVPRDKLLIETDSPYLSVHSGINTPAHIGEVASVIAGHLGLSVGEVLSISLQNGLDLYK